MPSQENVWDYPRPPRLEPCTQRLKVVLGGETIADTTRAYRVLETSHPPVDYFPPEDIRTGSLKPAVGSSFCEWKGNAIYFDVCGGSRTAERSAWSYPDPTPKFRPIAKFVAFYPAPMDVCTVDGEQVTPQPGGFYGGWVTANLIGPFKGGPGTSDW